MKKAIFKAMAAGVLVTAFASCTDDLSVSQGKFAGKADLIATLDDGAVNTRLGMLEVDDHNPWVEKREAGWKWVFSKGDKVRVWALESQQFEVYNLIGGWDSPSGTFKKDEQSATLPGEYNRWAVTDAQFAYSLSPNANGEPVLTYTIPYKYTANSNEADGTENANVRTFPAPFWGPAIVNGSDEEATIDVTLKALTAFLRIDMETLPEGTQYIVLTTHGFATQNGDQVQYDGFQLLEPDPNYTWNVGAPNNHVKDIDGEFNLNTLSSWYDATDNTPKGLVKDGNSESLTGTFNTVLEEGAALHVDEGLDNEEEGDDWGMANISRLVTRDEMVVKIPEGQKGGVFWLPIIAQHYNNLHVLAVVDRPSQYTYKYIGKELKNYNNMTFEVGGRYRLTMNMTQLGKVCAHQLNEAIEEINHKNKYNLDSKNIIYVDELIDCVERDDSHVHQWTDQSTNKHMHGNKEFKYPTDQILVQGTGDLVINIAKISATAQRKGYLSPVRSDLGEYTANGKEKVLFVSDKNYWPENYSFRTTRTGINTTTLTNIPKSVVINLPADWVAETETEKALLAELPGYDMLIAANNNYKPATQPGAQYLDVYAYGSATEFTSGNDMEIDNEKIKNYTDAAITVMSGIKSLNVMKGTKGDVFVDDLTEQKVEINEAMNVYTTEGINVRIDDGLVRKINFQQDCDNNENYVITRKSGALAAIDVLGNNTQRLQVPNDVNVISYWTGQALDADAINIREYDNGDIYSVAQLASMGEKIGQSTTASYKINGLVDAMWLGSKGKFETDWENYGWVGPEVTVDGFQFDGNNKTLYNMYMPDDAQAAGSYTTNKTTIYVYDPHICCTTCGWLPNNPSGVNEGSTNAIPLNHFGLIRSIKNGDGDNVIKNVKLNDVRFDKDEPICDGIGALVGYIETSGALTFSKNNVGETYINVENDYVGGLVGQIAKSGAITIENNTVANSVYGTGTIEGKNYVGGLIGAVDPTAVDAQTTPSITITSSLVNLANNIDASGSYAGGLIGKAEAGTIILTPNKPTKVLVTGSISAGMSDESNTAFGEYAGGLIGYNKADNNYLANATVKAGEVSARDGYVGGEIGYLYGGSTKIGNYVGKSTTNLETEIDIEKMAGAFAVGGLVGNNDNNALVAVLTGYKGDAAEGTNGSFVTVDIASFENTKGSGNDALESYYSTRDSKAKKAGTFSNIIGKLDGIVYIAEKNLTVVDNLQSETKIALGYQLRPDANGTYADGTRKFWGDYRGYVGAGASGNYFLLSASKELMNDSNAPALSPIPADPATVSAATAVTGDQAADLYGYNLYKTNADYSDKSCNAPAGE